MSATWRFFVPPQAGRRTPTRDAGGIAELEKISLAGDSLREL
ncbi:hypothetical protein [Chitinophaga sp. Cy-1792]|nr:hypothetical protein [Chitinophaga sp. Cy-1792]